MAGTGFDVFNTGEFGRMAQQYWNAWNSMAGAAPAAPAPGMLGAGFMPPWFQAPPQPAPPEGLEAAMRQFGAQAMGWYGQMQQLASQFAGRESSAADIARAWKQMLGQGVAPGFDQSAAFAQSLPVMQSLRAWLQLPTFGFTREHQERWQRLAQAQLDVQERGAAFASMMSETLRDAADRFERKLADRSQPGKQVESGRALFDLWIDAAEESYADVALSERYREVYGAFVDAQMRARAALQAEVEQVSSQLNMPTRTEMDASHRKVVELERTVRRLRDAVEALSAAGASKGVHDAAGATPASAKPARKSGSKSEQPGTTSRSKR